MGDTVILVVDEDPESLRVVEGQRVMQASSDLLLGWETTHGLDGVAFFESRIT